MFLTAFRMKCEGGYYEDAAKFADDYAEARRKSKNGEVVMGIGFAVNMNLIFPITLVYSIIVTVMLGALASIRFRSMEQLE